MSVYIQLPNYNGTPVIAAWLQILGRIRTKNLGTPDTFASWIWFEPWLSCSKITCSVANTIKFHTYYTFYICYLIGLLTISCDCECGVFAHNWYLHEFLKLWADMYCKFVDFCGPAKKYGISIKIFGLREGAKMLAKKEILGIVQNTSSPCH